ncbi:MAG TPA: LPS assembly protein LptD [Syntrophorhabdaceae bacterium]|nr:LPS assembly protein LptD [Syntrophorhabdaceae bacterium]HON85465.1 LPS assembly protein LptD [Syntrophorhabdaceae bacterium]HOT41414.1 LPS assembly protein LptD [Syntrophorhabdaceae bacterium]HQE79787.1 LPS assembly protein LptD [Syntrophorhabdaceae bacterium]HQH43397.1 LPS assembly protein LptD [Syntrophorhabdaceae bacterium]
MRFFKLLILISLMFLPFTAHGKRFELKSPINRPVDISAYFLEYNGEKNIYTARGSVELIEGSRRLTADSIVYDQQNGDITAQGNVVFQDEEDMLQCERLYLNLFTRKGTVERGKIFIKKGNFNIAGDKIAKTGDSTYNIKAGEITTCDPERPEWKFQAKDVDITIEGYAKTKGTVFYILNTPVFYLPYGIFPVKTERQSGFLMPEFSTSSRDGIIIRNSFFWAIARDKDATLKLDYIEQRGLNFGSEFRYSITEDTKGTWYAAIMKDNDYKNTRYRIKGRHEQDVIGNLKFKMDVDHVSDKDYLKDLSTTTSEKSEAQLKSNLYFEKPFQNSLFTYEMAYFKNLLIKDNDMTFKYAPHMTYFTESFPVLKNRFFFDLSSSMTNFYRETGDKYSRLSFEPRLQLPYSWNALNLLFSGKAYETGYLINKATTHTKTTKMRQTFKVQGDANVQLIRDYYTGKDRSTGYQSLIKPEIKYTFIPNSSYRELPYIDPYDRIYKANIITYSLNHYLNHFSYGETREVSLFQLEQTYGLSGSLSPSNLYEGYGNRFSDTKGRFIFYLSEDISFGHESVFNTYGNGFKTVKNSLNYSQPNIYRVNLSHTYTKYLDNQIYLDLGGTYKDIDGRYQIRYSFRDAAWIDTLYQLTYHPSCWAVTLTLVQTQRPRDTSLRFAFDLAGITKMR